MNVMKDINVSIVDIEWNVENLNGCGLSVDVFSDPVS
jgi:hypothetical protein